MSSRGDQLFEQAAEKLEDTAERAEASGGIAGKLAEPLAEDAHFLRKLKPSLVAARVRGRAPKSGREATGPTAPSGPQLGPRRPAGSGGPNPLAVIAAALVLGIVLARIVDWRSHAHPRS